MQSNFFIFRHSKIKNIQEKLKQLEEDNFFITRIFIAGDFEIIQNYQFLENTFPCVFIGNTTEKSEDCYFGIQCVQNIQNYKKIEETQKIIGVTFSTHENTFLQVSNLSSFEEITTTLQQEPFSGKNIVRFWNYIEHVLEHYQNFNLARNSFFENEKITRYPAATGIDAKLIGKNLSLSFDAIQGDFQQEILHSDLQCEAKDYGPKFSRGQKISFQDTQELVYISGTSSVDLNGKSIFLQNPQKNVEYVLDCFFHILKQAKHEEKNIQFAIIYAKNKNYFQIFLDEYKKRNYSFPFISVFVDVCRDDFFLEIEGFSTK